MPHFYWVSCSPEESFVRQMWGVKSELLCHWGWRGITPGVISLGEASLSSLKDRHLKKSLYRLAHVCGSKTLTHAVTPLPSPCIAIHCNTSCILWVQSQISFFFINVLIAQGFSGFTYLKQKAEWNSCVFQEYAHLKTAVWLIYSYNQFAFPFIVTFGWRPLHELTQGFINQSHSTKPGLSPLPPLSPNVHTLILSQRVSM